MPIDIAAITGEGQQQDKTEQDMFKLASLAMSKRAERQRQDRYDQVDINAHVKGVTGLVEVILKSMDTDSSLIDIASAKTQIDELKKDEIFMESPIANSLLDIANLSLDQTEDRAGFKQEATSDLVVLRQDLENLWDAREENNGLYAIEELGNLIDRGLKDVAEDADYLNQTQKTMYSDIIEEMRSIHNAYSGIRQYDSDPTTDVMEYGSKDKYTVLNPVQKRMASLAKLYLDGGNHEKANDILGVMHSQYAMQAYQSSGSDKTEDLLTNAAHYFNNTMKLLTKNDDYSKDFNSKLEVLSTIGVINAENINLSTLGDLRDKVQNWIVDVFNRKNKNTLWGPDHPIQKDSSTKDLHAKIMTYINTISGADGQIDVEALYAHIDLGGPGKHGSTGQSMLEHQDIKQVLELYKYLNTTIDMHNLITGGQLSSSVPDATNSDAPKVGDTKTFNSPNGGEVLEVFDGTSWRPVGEKSGQGASDAIDELSLDNLNKLIIKDKNTNDHTPTNITGSQDPTSYGDVEGAISRLTESIKKKDQPTTKATTSFAPGVDNNFKKIDNDQDVLAALKHNGYAFSYPIWTGATELRTESGPGYGYHKFTSREAARNFDVAKRIMPMYEKVADRIKRVNKGEEVESVFWDEKELVKAGFLEIHYIETKTDSGRRTDRVYTDAKLPQNDEEMMKFIRILYSDAYGRRPKDFLPDKSINIFGSGLTKPDDLSDADMMNIIDMMRIMYS